MPVVGVVSLTVADAVGRAPLLSTATAPARERKSKFEFCVHSTRPSTASATQARINFRLIYRLYRCPKAITRTPASSASMPPAHSRMSSSKPSDNASTHLDSQSTSHAIGLRISTRKR